MGIFNKKKSVTEELPHIELKHEHVWKDFPWYMIYEFDTGARKASYKIIEPYVCITCSERKDVCLEQRSWQGIDADTRDRWFNKVRNRYKKYLKPKAVVEDMINNTILVKDAQRLNMLEKMYGLPHPNCGTSASMNLPTKEDDFKIKLPESEKNEMDSR